jgi:selenophosphate synthetase-related protein
MMKLKDIITEIRQYPGITRKRAIGPVVEILRTMDEHTASPVVTDFGEDAAALKYNDHYLLLAAEGMWPQFVNAEPYAAGKAAVMASVNDIYAMGGKPLALVNVLSAATEDDCRLIMEGVRKGCQKLKVPMVGGHLNPDARETSLSVAILGTAQRLLQCTNAREGQKIILAVDLKGVDGQCKSVESWDANSGKTSEYIVERLDILRSLAETDLCRTAKDVSNGGILGTLALLCECSRKGCVVMLDKIPQPPGVHLLKWLKAFLSYGFILCVDDYNLSPCLDSFHRKGIAAEVIGEVVKQPHVVIRSQGTEKVLYDFNKESIIGA